MTKSNFADRVREIVRAIPRGQALTYQRVAELAGSPGAARAVGNIMSRNDDKNIPCHRVIRSDGQIGAYNGLRGEKARLLQEEGFIK